jgi:hypothetical protein
MFKNRSGFLLSLIFFLTANTHAKEFVTPKEIEQFGWEYVDKKVSMTGILSVVWACKSHKGSVCTSFLFENTEFDIALFQAGITSRIIKPFMKKCVEVTGNVRDLDSGPLLVIEEIRKSNSC